jgi:ribosome-binding protein aMBF1 (putative translation factor)
MQITQSVLRNACSAYMMRITHINKANPMKSPLRQAREKRGLTLKDVASGVSMDPGNLSRVERGEQVPSKDIVEALARFFDNSVTELEIIYPERFQ